MGAGKCAIYYFAGYIPASPLIYFNLSMVTLVWSRCNYNVIANAVKPALPQAGNLLYSVKDC